MYIMTLNGAQIINSEFVERFCLVDKEDATLVVASYGANRGPVTMGRYLDMDEGRKTLGALLGALAGGQAVFYMPESTLFDQEYIKKDARTRRKGGS